MVTQDKKGKTFELDTNVTKVILCSGKIYYELYHARNRKLKAKHSAERSNAKKITIVRLEQLAPFPMDRVASAVNNFPGAEVAWVQEEPKNQGAYSYIVPRFQTSMKYFYRGTEGGTEGDLPLLKYIGRPVSATTAGGSFRLHGNEQRDLIERALAV